MQQADTLDRTAAPLPERALLTTVRQAVADRFSVIVPVFNCQALLRACFDSLLAAAKQYGNAEVIAVDNGSSDGSYEILQAEYPSVTLLRFPEISIAALRNRGVEVGDGEFLSFIDADCTVPLGYFEEARATFNDPQVTATGSMCGVPESSTWVERAWYALNSDRRNGLVKYLNSGNFVVRRQAFLEVGGFDETLTTGEDTELGQRMRGRGYSLYQNQRVHAVHLRNSKTLGQFFRRHAWHGQGLMIASSASRLNKPLLMTAGHLLLTLAGLLQLFDTHYSLGLRIAVLLAAANLVPAVTFLYRSLSHRRFSSPLAGVVLYQVYYAAKLCALFQFASGRRRRTYHA
jgi:glycosyltransferase involved in cell wall biosynthesis